MKKSCPYVSPDFLSSEKACAIFRSTREEIADIAQKLADATGEKPDMSVTALPVREDLARKSAEKEGLESFSDAVSGRKALVFRKTARGRG